MVGLQKREVHTNCVSAGSHAPLAFSYCSKPVASTGAAAASRFAYDEEEKSSGAPSKASARYCRLLTRGR
jgi:hypothetical protein